MKFLLAPESIIAYMSTSPFTYNVIHGLPSHQLLTPLLSLRVTFTIDVNIRDIDASTESDI